MLSEINGALPATGGVRYSHARDHLFGYVETKTKLVDGKLCDTKGDEIRSWVDYYVCPKGFLRKNKNKKSYKYRHTKREYRKTEEGEWLILHEDVWYAVTMKEYKPTSVKTVLQMIGKISLYREHKEYPYVFDCLHKVGSFAFSDTLNKWYGTYVYATHKRQLGKREIKKYRLEKVVAA